MINLPRLRCLSLLKQRGLVMNQLKQIHAQVIINGYNCRHHSSIIGMLVESYFSVSAADGINNARLVFKHTDEPDVFVSNVMIRCIPPKEAIQLFANAIALNILACDEFTYIYILGACARSLSSTTLVEGKQIHSRILKTGFVHDVVVQTTGLHFYASHGDCSSSRKLFDEVPNKTCATWNAMISGYCSQKNRVGEHAREALRLFSELWHDSYAPKPTDTTMVCVLSACSRTGNLGTGSCIHGLIEKTIFMPHEDVYFGTSLVDMYSKCGCLSSASSVFNRMKIKNILTWTSMMTGLALHGRGEEALEMFDAMQATNIRPNAVTFTSLLVACCHAGLTQEGLLLFKRMSSEFDVVPTIQHYGCVIDLLGRAGNLHEAYNFIIGMPLQPDAILWRSLLGACRTHGDVVLGEKVGKHLLLLQQEKGMDEPRSMCEDFIALSNVYASAERWDELQTVRQMMKDKRIQIEPGCSTVQLV